ncbi:MAG: methylated-DNA--[protein]-cysteine S-methyltransferase [Bacteroidales bacterium]|nr:methylated-DNA--[protein]-cysteine S-methyltransferase [Bacteroidales bacterium]
MRNIITIEYFKTAVGELILGSIDNKLCLCDWRYRKMRTSIDTKIQEALNAEYIEGSSEIIETTKSQLNEYFLGERIKFDIPLLLIGSDFQKTVWNALLQIPYGTTETYQGLSKRLANEKAIRAVASANGANAIAIIIPCHRIIGSDGKLVGYAGGLGAKNKLLNLENALNKDQLSLF